MTTLKKLWLGGADLHELDLHRHVDGEEHPDGVRLPEDQGVLQGEARTGVPGGGVPGRPLGGGHAVGGEGRDDGRAHDHGEAPGSTVARHSA